MRQRHAQENVPFVLASFPVAKSDAAVLQHQFSLPSLQCSGTVVISCCDVPTLSLGLSFG